MKIIYIERLETTDSYYITKAKFKNLWGKEFISTCITEKKIKHTKFFDTGYCIPVSLWNSFLAFLESDKDYIQP